MRVVNQIVFTAKDDAEAIRLATERLGRDAVILSSQMVKEGGVFGLFQKSVLRVTAGILEEDDNSSPARPVAKKNPAPSSSSSISSMDEETRRENLIAFQKLMEFKERSERKTVPAQTQIPVPTPSSSQIPDNSPIPLGDEGYMTGSMNTTDTIRISEQALRSAYGQQPRITPAPPITNLNPNPNPNLNLNPVPANQPSQNPIPVSSPVSQIPDNTQRLTDQVGALADKIDSLIQRLAAVEKQTRNSQQNFQPISPLSNVQNVTQSSDPERNFIEQRLRASGVDEKYISKLVADYMISKGDPKQKKIPFNKWLAKRIYCAADEKLDAVGGRKVMMFGPTGVGKTTTIAKLAAIKALWEHKKVLLLTSDTYRIAAVEQLKTYAKILGVPIEIIFDTTAIPAIVDEYESSDIILLDTAGRSQRDKENIKIFENLYNSFTPDAVHLVLAANMKYEDMLDVVEHIPAVPISHLLFTKLDETVSYGAMFNIQQVIGAPISFLTLGQNVPKDIETASGARIADFLMKTQDERRQ